MDKTSLALTTAEDNAEEIRRLKRSLSSYCAMPAASAVSGGTSLGNVSSAGGVGVVITFVGGSATLSFCGETVVTASSPIVAVLPYGSGELTLAPARSDIRCLIIGGR